MPEHTTFAVGGSGFFDGSDGFAHGIELVVTCQYLGTLFLLLGETDEVAQDLD